MNARALRSAPCSALALLVVLASGASCEHRSAPAEAFVVGEYDPFPELRAFEAKQRAQTDFATLAPSDHAFGADPIAIAPIGDGKRFVSLLRGRDAIVVLDSALGEQQRLSAPRSPSGMAVSLDGKTVFVVGERDGYVARYSVQETPPHLVAAGRYDLPDVRTLRDVAVSPEGVVYVVEEDRGRLISLVPQPFDSTQADTILPARRTDVTIGGNPIQVARVDKFVIVNSLLAHSLEVRTVNDDGTVKDTPETRIKHDGPIWSFSAVPSRDGLLVLVGGVEDHPLDRTGGFFGYVDSFVFLYDVQAGKAQRVATVNVSELGVVTPKAVQLEETSDGRRSAFVTGYGSDKLVQFVFGDTGKPPSDVRTQPLPAGSRAFTRTAAGKFVIANPLLDAFVTLSTDGIMEKIVPAVDTLLADTNQRGRLRVGEALFFTTLMAPWNKTDDAHSRFTCETCHFEGYVDGRIHHTGRGEVRVVSKPLLGLFNNRPHFSRALDPDLSSVAHNEFRVAGAGNDLLPWFSLDPPRAYPTLLSMPEGSTFGSGLSPLQLRESLMSFLMSFSHRTNPAVEGRSTFSALESEGARVFRDKCESCHQARTSTDEPLSRISSLDSWEHLIFSPSGPIVWAMNEYRQTGVVPYVHERGARVPSLRRLYKKRPYLTSGAAKDVPGVLNRVGFTDGGGFSHDGAPQDAKRLGTHEIATLQSFLALL